MGLAVAALDDAVLDAACEAGVVVAVAVIEADVLISKKEVSI